MLRMIVHVFRDRSVLVESGVPMECLVIDESGEPFSPEAPHCAAVIPDDDLDEAFARHARGRFNPFAEEA